MNPIQALDFILTEYSHSILQHKKRVAAMLKDLCPTDEHLQTINLLILALNERIPHELSTSSSPNEILETQLIKKLENSYGISYKLAQRTVIYWSNAIFGATKKVITAKEKFQEIQKLAKEGNTHAQYKVGKIYLIGTEDIKPDIFKAKKYFEEAAKKNHALAQNNLGACYEYGYGTEYDDDQAIFWYQKSAKQGCSLAQYNLARCYEYGIGIEKNDELAFDYYKLAADQGDSEAQYSLAWYYLNGEIVEQDLIIACNLYLSAANQGHMQAQFNLAHCYETGKGIPKNLLLAEKWYSQAAQQSEHNAQKAYTLI